MTMQKHKPSRYLAAVLALALLAPRAHASYLDPTTGSIAFQTAIGGLLAGLALVRIYSERLR